MSYIVNKDTILKEGHFKKRKFRGDIVKKYTRYYFVLTDRYLDWYDYPKGARKGSIPLSHIYARIHDGSGLVIGSWLSKKEYLLRDEGPCPATVVNEWYSEINRSIDNFKNDPKNVPKNTLVPTSSMRGNHMILEDVHSKALTVDALYENRPPAPSAIQYQVMNAVHHPPTQTVMYTQTTPIYSCPVQPVYEVPVQQAMHTIHHTNIHNIMVPPPQVQTVQTIYPAVSTTYTTHRNTFVQPPFFNQYY